LDDDININNIGGSATRGYAGCFLFLRVEFSGLGNALAHVDERMKFLMNIISRSKTRR
jgi:hypothetical protein